MKLYIFSEYREWARLRISQWLKTYCSVQQSLLYKLLPSLNTRPCTCCVPNSEDCTPSIKYSYMYILCPNREHWVWALIMWDTLGAHLHHFTNQTIPGGYSSTMCIQLPVTRGWVCQIFILWVWTGELKEVPSCSDSYPNIMCTGADVAIFLG